MPAVTSLLIVGAGVAVAAWTSRTEKRRRLAILRHIADRRGGTLDPGGLFGTPSVALRFDDGIAMSISLWSNKQGKFTEYRMSVRTPGLPGCKVAPIGFVDWVGKALGAQDIEIGVPDFDDAFVVKGDDPGLVVRLWPRDRAELMAVTFGTSQLDCTDAGVKLLEPVIGTVEHVEVGIDLLLELARCDVYGEQVLAQLPEATVGGTGSFVYAELPGPSRIRVGPVEQGGIVRTCARTAAIGDLPGGAETLVTPVAATLEQADGELRIWWNGIETDPRRLTAAIDVLRQLAAGPPQGVFR